MTRLVDVAREAGVSTASVSLYINGKAEGRMTQETQSKIRAAIDKTGYKVKKSQARAREAAKTVAILWSVDARLSFVGNFFGGFQEAIMKSETSTSYNFVIHPYESGRLQDKSQVLVDSPYAGAVIANTSFEDIQYLRSLDLDIPIVIINRHIRGLSSVYIDNEGLALRAAKEVKDRGVKTLASLVGQPTSMMISDRFVKFLEFARDLGIQAPNDLQIRVEDSLEGGQEGARLFLAGPGLADVIFCATDEIAFGLVHGLVEAGVKIPQDVQVFCYGFDSPALTEFGPVSISSLDISVFKMAQEALSLLLDILEEGPGAGPRVRELEASLNIRSSFS